MSDQIYRFGDYALTGSEVLLAGGAAALLLLLVLALAAWRRAARRAQEAEEAGALREEIVRVAKTQAEISGQMQAMQRNFASSNEDIRKTLDNSREKTHADLSQLNARLVTIDTAQKKIDELTSQTVQLQQVLADKQTRGAFGEGRMEAIVRANLPHNAYVFQGTLTNGKRPDCLIKMPDGGPSLVVDAKFPLEAWLAIRAAADVVTGKAAEKRFRQDVLKHVQDIADRYLVAGETLDTAFMFVPSESVFADIHEHFEDIVQAAHRLRVVIVSPSLLMLSIQVIMSLLRDQRVREQAHLIQAEVLRLMDDVGRLDQRVRNLRSHFDAANEDVRQILISSDKITSRRAKIESVELEDNQVKDESQPDLLE